jgi:antitoxin component YwqK of YwqJK toxin-antitoxin module
MKPIQVCWPNGQIKFKEYKNCGGQSTGKIYEWYESGQIERKIHYTNDKWHSIESPAYCEWYKSGQMKRKIYFENGQMHNVSGPAHRVWYESGRIRSEVYRVNGLRHNTNGPAVRDWHKSGQLFWEGYYENGFHHNINGPAAREWHESDKFGEGYYLNGDELTIDQWRDRTKPAEILRAISLLPCSIAVKVSHHYCKA